MNNIKQYGAPAILLACDYLKMPFISQAFLGWRLGFNFRNFRIRNLLLEKNLKY